MRVWAVLVTDYSDDSFEQLYIFDTLDKANEYVKINWQSCWLNYEIYEREVK